MNNLKNILSVRAFWSSEFSGRVQFRAFVLSFESFELFEKFKNGNVDGYISYNDFLGGDYWEQDGILYNEQYVLTRESDILHVDECNFCGGFQEYTNETLYTCNVGYRGSDSFEACKSYIRENDFFEYDGEYYDTDAIAANDLVYMFDGNIDHIDNAYYWESDGEYHYEQEEEEEDGEDYTRDYHSGRFQEKVIFSKNPKFFIGIEVEKEDEDVKESILIDDFENECKGYRKEKDGSLDDCSGFEMITPPYELNAKKIIETIKQNETLVKHFNANVSKSCGGHINISEDGLTGDEFFEKIKGYTPLFNALYFKRLEGRWCKAKSNEKLINDKEKYQSIRIHSNRVEFRLISALRNVDQLDWRLRLFELIVKNPTNCPREAFYIIHSKFKKHLKKIYKDNFETLNARIIEMTKDFENINLI
jgi:hypothetical protein